MSPAAEPDRAWLRHGRALLLVVACGAALACQTGGLHQVPVAAAAPAPTTPPAATGSAAPRVAGAPAARPHASARPTASHGSLVVTRLVQLALTPAAPKAGATIRVRGRLVDTRGHGIAGQPVLLAAIGSRGYPTGATTAADGSFTLDALVPPGTPAGRTAVGLAFGGDDRHVPSEATLVVPIAPGGMPVVIPPALQAPSPMPANPGDPAPAPTVIRPPARTPAPVATMPAARSEALPRWLLWSLGGLALVGTVSGLGVAATGRGRRAEEYDSFISPAGEP